MASPLQGTSIRKPNRVSRPVRVTQKGTRTAYPGRNHKREKQLRNRWAGA